VSLWASESLFFSGRFKKKYTRGDKREDYKKRGVRGFVFFCLTPSELWILESRELLQENFLGKIYDREIEILSSI